MKTTKKKAVKKAAKKTKDIADSYNKYKIYNGKQYTGMKVGRRHKWYYDEGIWIDKKLTPDKWVINFEVTKRRAGKAPEGSGVPVGTEYHWYIMAHQMVKKIDANSYTTSLNGFKFKLAHKRSEKKEWSINEKKQKTQLVKILQRFIAELEAGDIEETKELIKKSAASRKAPAKKAKKKEKEKELMAA